jgi:predicted Rdx family selenoprotein
MPERRLISFEELRENCGLNVDCVCVHPDNDGYGDITCSRDTCSIWARLEKADVCEEATWKKLLARIKELESAMSEASVLSIGDDLASFGVPGGNYAAIPFDTWRKAMKEHGESTRTVSVSRLVEIRQLLDTMCAWLDVYTATLVRDWLDEVIGGDDEEKA